MSTRKFVDYYDLLQVSSNADADTIERIFRHLAKKYHPDNAESADNERFKQIIEAHRILADPETRASYDGRYQDYWNQKWRIASEASDSSTFAGDHVARERLLSLLYVQRRRNMGSPGMGDLEMARLLATPPELVEFHLWYLKAKGWVERLQTGHLAITAKGVDQIEKSGLLLNANRLIAAPAAAGEDAEEGEDRDLIDYGE